MNSSGCVINTPNRRIGKLPSSRVISRFRIRRLPDSPGEWEFQSGVSLGFIRSYFSYGFLCDAERKTGDTLFPVTKRQRILFHVASAAGALAWIIPGAHAVR